MYILNCTEEIRWPEQGGVASAADSERRRSAANPGVAPDGYATGDRRPRWALRLARNR